MSLALEIIKSINGFSRAKYSTWFYYKPDHILFDAGEGVSTSMRNMLYGINSIFLSHNHGDHIGGISGILRSRASSMGDITKPLSIYYPAHDRSIERLRDYLGETMGNLPFALHWKPLQPGNSVPLAANRRIEAFASKHIERILTLGYKVIEERTRLKLEYRQLPQQQLVQVIREKGKEEVSESYDKILLVYTGDTMPLDTHHIQGAEVVIYDATFVDPSDREDNTHATVDEACQSAKDAGVSSLALFHFSGRYRRQQIKDKILENIKKRNITFPVYYIFPTPYPMEFKQIEE